MTGMSRRIPTSSILLAVMGVLSGWTGGFLLSSGYSRCIDGMQGGQCTGRYASDGWHAVGAAALILGGALVIAGIAAAVRYRRRTP